MDRADSITRLIRAAIRHSTWALVVLAYALLLFSRFWPLDLRNSGSTHVNLAWIAFTIESFKLQLLMLVGMFVLAAGALRDWRTVVISLPLVIGLAVSWIGFLTTDTADPTANKIRIMSTNVLTFNRMYRPVTEEVLAAAPDVVVFEEVSRVWGRKLRRGLDRDYPYSRIIDRDTAPGTAFGIAIFSRRPFAGGGVTAFGLGPRGIKGVRVTIDFGGRKLAVYGVHLTPPITFAHFTNQRLMLADLRDKLTQESLPYVVAGDFNFSGSSTHADVMRGLGLRDALDLGCRWTCATWPGQSRRGALLFPDLRPDHIYTTQDFKVTHARTAAPNGSDHRPVIADLQLD